MLLEMASDFEEIHQRTAGLTVPEALEVAAATLLRYSPQLAVVNRPFYFGFETWYMQFMVVMQWYADSAALDADTMRPLIQRIVFNRDGFSSYRVKPIAAQFFGQAIADHLGSEYHTVDSTACWLQHRTSLPSAPEVPQLLGCGDRHLLFIETVDTGWLLCKNAALPTFFAFLMGG